MAGRDSHWTPGRDYDGHHYPATGTGGGGVESSGSRSAGEQSWEVVVAETGERVTIVQKVGDVKYGSILKAQDGRQFVPVKHGLGVRELVPE